ncbi:hypothetical protein KIH74_21930 [Kineosporia sp. J2-2]|uniref:Uncharacterized protein n=1 Tax=Kineosporia corallincola TaxID=2835133 RepID=A0ABS5TML3_9ACTN|nr:hypothetical protein [Kineosporia corallincola]MBT0771614.1 hypothetical protein [Kineosporia corallincola]
MTEPTPDPSTAARDEIALRLTRPGLDHVELEAPGLRLRVDVVSAGRLFYWITFVATTDETFATAAGARAAMRSFPWTMPFRPKLERHQAGLPVLCRWQRAYADDTAALCLTLLGKHFRVSPDEIQVSGVPGTGEGGEPLGNTPPEAAAKSQKVWLREVTGWFMRPGRPDPS